MVRGAVALLALALAASPLRAEGPHDDLCAAMAGEYPDLAAARVALEGGASPNESCSYSYTTRRIHAAGAIMSVVTGGLWLMSPIVDEDLLTEKVRKTRSVKPMRHAADLRHQGLLELLLEHGASIDTLDGAFAAAVEAGELAWAEKLVGFGAERGLGQVPVELLHRARLERLLALEPDLSAAGLYWNEETVERMAADPVLLDLLLEAGLDPATLRSAFGAAVTQEELELAARLAELGAPRKLREIDGEILGSERRLQAVLVLEPELEDLELGWGDIGGAEVANPRVLQQLVAAGYPLAELAFRAAESHSWDRLDRVLALGFDIDAEWDGRFHRRMLNEAVDDGDHEAVAALLDRGAAILDGVFDHPVEVAIEDDDGVMLALLLDGMPDRAEARDWWGRVLRAAVYAGDVVGAAEALRDGRLGGTDLSEFAKLAMYDLDRAMLELLLERGADRQAAADAALRAAAVSADVEGVRLALELGADSAGRGPGGETALNCAAHAGTGDGPAVLRILVDAGAPVDGFEDQKVPPLHLALEEGNTESVEALVELGADPGRLDVQGRTAARVAVEERRWEALVILAEAGAPLDGALILEAAARYPYAPAEAVLAMAHGQHAETPRFFRQLARKVGRRDAALAAELRIVARELRLARC